MLRAPMVALVPLLAAAAAPAQTTPPTYTLDVRIDPPSGGIAVAGRLQHACTGDSVRLYLNDGFVIEEIRDAAGPIAARVDSAGARMPYTTNTRRLVLGRAACTLSFRYHGRIRDPVMNVNMITPALVELASYAGWYPESPDFTQVAFDLTATLPAGWLVTGNGRELSRETAHGLQTVRFADQAPGFDIVLVAAPNLTARRRSADGAMLEMVSPDSDSAVVDGILDDLLGALHDYASWYGPAAAGGDLRVVYSPRAGWGYSRIPLIMVSAAYRDRELAQPLGAMRVMHGAAHELAHFWWALAPVATGEDWINEGFAEYSATAAVAARFGETARDSLLVGYRRDAARSQTGATIAATPTSSPDRYVNRYEKTALLLTELERTYGAEQMHAALAAVYARFKGTRSATTPEVLAIMGDVLGPEAAARLRTCVVDTAWHERCPM